MILFFWSYLYLLCGQGHDCTMSFALLCAILRHVAFVLTLRCVLFCLVLWTRPLVFPSSLLYCTIPVTCPSLAPCYYPLIVCPLMKPQSPLSRFVVVVPWDCSKSSPREYSPASKFLVNSCLSSSLDLIFLSVWTSLILALLVEFIFPIVFI